MMKESRKNVALTGIAAAAAIASGTKTYGAVVNFTLPTALPGAASNTAGAAAEHSTIDIDGDGQIDVGFVFYAKAATSGTGNWIAGIYANSGGLTGGGSVGYTGAYGTYATKLAAGATVGPTSTFAQEVGYYTILTSRFSNKNYGQFKNNARGFVGFDFVAGDGALHYAYIELQTSRTTGVNFFSGAYETTANAAITIPAATPEPSSLAALAFGAAALMHRRRDQSN